MTITMQTVRATFSVKPSQKFTGPKIWQCLTLLSYHLTGLTLKIE